MPDIDYKKIGQRIASRRKELDMTLAGLAASVDLSASTIQRYEKGKFDRIKLPVVEAIAEALCVNPAWLIGKTDDPNDYENGDLLAEIPLSYVEACDGDMKQAYSMWRAAEQDAAREAAEARGVVPKIEREIKNPDIRMIARAGQKMTPEQAENLRKYAQFMYPEAFNDNE